MWGLHIGLGFTTRVTFGGFWLLVALALASGDPAYSAALMLAHWLGRSLPVWIGPTLVKSGSDVPDLPSAILADRSVYQGLVGFALVWSAGVAVLAALRTGFPEP
jgi:hypothetical protein